MDIKDLMIGDWILFEPFKNDSTPKRVGGIDGSMVSINCLWEAFHHIRPIPLTKEILQKNGVDTWEEPSTIVQIGSIEIDKETKMYFQIRQGDKEVFMRISHIGAGSYELRMSIRFVHQLQHAIKLCGINKDIEI